MKAADRLCEVCRKPGGTMAFRYFWEFRWRRGYFHPDCFARYKVKLDWITKGGKT